MENLINLIKSGVTTKPEGVDETLWTMAISAAYSAAPAPTNEVAVVEANNTAVATTTPGGAFTAAQFLSSTLDVDHWLKIAFGSTRLGDLIVGVPALKVSIDLSEGVTYKMGIKVQPAGGQVKYAYTEDGVYSTDNELWSRVVDDFQKMASPGTKVKPYRTADLRFTLTENVLGQMDASGQAPIIAKAGEVIGNTLSTTSWYAWQKVLNELAKTKRPVDSGVIELEIGREDTANNQKNNYAVFTYKLI